MYILSSMTDAELIRATFGTSNPLVRLLAERLDERNAELHAMIEWADSVSSAVDTLTSKIDDRPD